MGRFPGQEHTTDEAKAVRPLKKFSFTVDDAAYAETGTRARREVTAHDVFFYDGARVGFWIDKPDGERFLVLSVIAADVWEEE